MNLFTTIFERLPMVWFLLGLLFNSTGLYLGFEYSLAFGYLLVGWFCCAYGLALFVFRLQERPRASAETRLSPDFVQAGATVIMPVTKEVENAQAARQSNADEKAP
jgi:hypothetical protein